MKTQLKTERSFLQEQGKFVALMLEILEKGVKESKTDRSR